MSVRQAPCPSNIVQHNHIRPEDPNKRLQEGQYETSVPTVRDRVAQQAAKIVLEPVFEADFLPVSFGFRPRRSTTDALEQIRMAFPRGRQFVFEADIRDFLDALSHCSFR